MSDLNRPEDGGDALGDDAPAPPDGADRDEGASEASVDGDGGSRVLPDLGALPPPPD